MDSQRYGVERSMIMSESSIQQYRDQVVAVAARQYRYTHCAACGVDLTDANGKPQRIAPTVSINGSAYVSPGELEAVCPECGSPDIIIGR